MMIFFIFYLMSPLKVQGIEKLTDGLYQLKVSEDCFMVMERVTKENMDKWMEFSKEVLSNIEAMDYNAPHRFPLMSSVMAFMALLIQPASETWVVYETDIERTGDKSFTEDWTSHIEMSFILSTDENIPFTNHMGITRNPLYNFSPHKNISLALHSFAAKVSLMEYPHKKYMLNFPLRYMAQLLMKALPENTYQWGDDGKFVTFKGNQMIFHRERVTIQTPRWLDTSNIAFVVPLVELSKISSTD